MKLYLASPQLCINTTEFLSCDHFFNANKLLLRSSLTNSTDGEVDESVKRDQSVRDDSLDNGLVLTEEVTGSTEAQPNEREVSERVPEGEVVPGSEGRNTRK